MQLRVNGKLQTTERFLRNGSVDIYQDNWHSGITLHPALRIHDAHN